jgi:hypothetical protein
VGRTVSRLSEGSKSEWSGMIAAKPDDVIGGARPVGDGRESSPRLFPGGGMGSPMHRIVREKGAGA